MNQDLFDQNLQMQRARRDEGTLKAAFAPGVNTASLEVDLIDFEDAKTPVLVATNSDQPFPEEAAMANKEKGTGDLFDFMDLQFRDSGDGAGVAADEAQPQQDLIDLLDPTGATTQTNMASGKTDDGPDFNQLLQLRQEQRKNLT